jgi:hypothetical protein
MKCPLCDLENPQNTIRCDCGYDFASRQLKDSLLPQEEKEAEFERIGTHGTKALSEIVDSIIVGIVMFYLIFNTENFFHLFPMKKYTILLEYCFFYSGYCFIFETCFQRTIGNMVTGTIVTMYDGSRPDIKVTIKRSLLRVPFLVRFSRRGKSWRDEITKTMVINIQNNSMH